MSEESSEDIDPTDSEHREIGHGLLEAEMGPSSSLAHLYRGEIHRMKLWRERLDRTTNWAVIIMAAILTWAFSSETNPHYVILVGGIILGVFLLIEARRYRGYDIWRSRVRTLQKNVFAYGLDPSRGLEDPNWREQLSTDYRTPTLKITAEEAVAHRLRRVYLPMFTILLLAWVVRVTAFADTRWPVSAAIGEISGAVVTMFIALCYLGMLIVTARSRTWYAEGELRMEDLRKE